jgi:hypothetical protein
MLPAARGFAAEEKDAKGTAGAFGEEGASAKEERGSEWKKATFHGDGVNGGRMGALSFEHGK